MKFQRGTSAVVAGVSAVAAFAISASPAFAGKAEQALLERVMAYATQPDVILVPPAGELSPPLGSFVVPYAPPGGGEPDPRKVGTYESAPSSCSEALRFREVSGAESRQELWATETGIGFSVGLPMVEIGGSWGRKSVAGMEYHITRKMVIDTSSLRDLEECCLRTPERCTNHYISEAWQGTGRIHRMVTSKAGLKPVVRQLEGTGSLDFSTGSGFTMASEWSQPQYFAYKTTAFQLPSCQSYMNSLPEEDGLVLFSGVSERTESEQEARRQARDDARRQVVEYLGQEYSIMGDQAISRAEAVISGVKDSLTCLDPVIESTAGPRYLARVRMYVERAELEGGMAGNDSAIGDDPAPAAPAAPSGRTPSRPR
jgi:hypothetical protein